MGRSRLPAVPLFDYIEKTFGISPINVADRLQISRALYSKWRSGALHLRGWQLVYVKNRFDLEWGIVVRLLSLQYPSSVVEEFLKDYIETTPATRKAEKLNRKMTLRTLKQKIAGGDMGTQSDPVVLWLDRAFIRLESG